MSPLYGDFGNSVGCLLGEAPLTLDWEATTFLILPDFQICQSVCDAGHICSARFVMMFT
jgi:hypothetical protein